MQQELTSASLRTSIQDAIEHFEKKEMTPFWLLVGEITANLERTRKDAGLVDMAEAILLAARAPSLPPAPLGNPHDVCYLLQQVEMFLHVAERHGDNIFERPSLASAIDRLNEELPGFTTGFMHGQTHYQCPEFKALVDRTKGIAAEMLVHVKNCTAMLTS